MKKIFNYLLILFVSFLTFSYILSLDVFAGTWDTITVEVKGIDNVYVNPGEESTTSVTISWHSSNVLSTLLFTEASDTKFENAATYQVRGTLDDQVTFHYYEHVTFYKCELELNNLTPGTDYIYKISTMYNKRSFETSVKSFRTSSISNFSFLWMGDIHSIAGSDGYGGIQGYRVGLAQKTVDYASDIVGGIDLIVTTGDETWRGSQYSNWQQWSYESGQAKSTLTSSYLWASGIGNHEYYCQCNSSLWNYYPEQFQSNNSAIYGNHEYYTNAPYNAMKALPDNGPDRTTYDVSGYWFLAGSVLFIQMDSMAIGEYAEVKNYQTWFKQVCEENAGKYQYLIVGQHYAWIDPNDGEDKNKVYSMSNWYKLFDQYGVDVAISGHEHTYYRSKPLYNKSVVSEAEQSKKGTVYCVTPQIGNRTSDAGNGWNNYWVNPDTQKNKNWIAANIDDRSLANKSGAQVFTVTNQGLEVKLVDSSGVVKDSYTVPCKRQIDCSTYADKVASSVNAITNTSENSAEFLIPEAYISLVKSMKVSNGSTTLGTLTPGVEMQDSLTLTNIKSNALYELTLDFEFVDGTKYQSQFQLSTFPYFGELYKFEVRFDKDNAKFTWADELLPAYSNLIDHFDIYEGNDKIGSVAGSEKTFSIAKTNIKNGSDSTFRLKAIASNGEVVCVKNYKYNGYGDLDFDGTITANDLNIISNALFNGVSLGYNQKSLSDVNNDGVVNYVDIIMIWMYNKDNKQEDLDYRTYTVIFKDLYGKVVATKNVEYGTDLSDVEGPTLEGYTFAGWSESVRYITEDMTVYAVYNK